MSADNTKDVWVIAAEDDILYYHQNVKDPINAWTFDPLKAARYTTKEGAERGIRKLTGSRLDVQGEMRAVPAVLSIAVRFGTEKS
jgi:hypothetical protein